MQRDGIVIRKIDVKHLDEEVARIIPVYDCCLGQELGLCADDGCRISSIWRMA